MNRSILHILAIVISVAILGPACAIAQKIELKTPHGADAARPIEGRIIVKLTESAFQRGVGLRALDAAYPNVGVYRASPWLNPALVAPPSGMSRSLMRLNPQTLALSRLIVVEYSSLASPHDVSAELSRSHDVEYAEPIYPRHLHYATNDPSAWQQWYLGVIGAPTAWDEIRVDTTIVVAVVDAGIDQTHEDLDAALWHNQGEMGEGVGGQDRRTNGIDDDGNGYVDDWRGYDFAGANGRTPDNDPTPNRESHATEMAGIIGAIGDNARGVVGVGFGARLMSLKITDEPTSQLDAPDLFNAHEAILYAAAMGADVINCSWGDLGRMRSEQEVITAATKQYGALVVASAGNSFNDEVFYPAGYDGVMSVGAVESGDAKAAFSNYNYRVDISAPGTHIYSLDLGNEYRYGQGTSHAAAVASGAAAIIRRRFPQLRPAEVVELLKATSDDNSGVLGEYAGRLGAGRINVANAVLSQAAISSARLEDYTVVDAGGDGIIDAGETVTLRADVRNYLADAQSVIASLTSVAPLIPITGGQTDFGPMARDQVLTTPAGTFQFTVPAGTAPNTVLTFKVSVQTPARTNDSYVQLTVAPTYMTTDLNRITATFNSSGNVAYNGTNRQQGDGFRLNDGKALLYHGGLMIGTGAARLSDVVRVGELRMGTAEGFQSTSSYRLNTTPDVETGRAIFNDAHRDASVRVGVEVSMSTYEYTDPRDSDFVLVVYDIRNASAGPIENLHAGLYLDWDISLIGEGDVATFDEPNRLGYVTNELVPDLVTGAALVSDGALTFNAVDNTDAAIASSFPPELKWQLLGNGIGARSTSPTDIGMVIGSGPFALDAGESRKVAFVLAAAGTLDDLRTAVNRAAARYDIISSTAEEIRGNEHGLSMPAVPNPTTGSSFVELSMKHAASVSVRLRDVAGRIVRETRLPDRASGSHTIPIDASGLSDGVYLYEIFADDNVIRGTIVKIAR